MTRIGRLIHNAWQADVQGKYTVQEAHEFAQYHAKTPWWRVALVCIGTPLPSILAVVLLDRIPVEPISAGARHSPHLWVRTWLSSVVMTWSMFEMLRIHVTGIDISTIQSGLLTMIVSTLTFIAVIAMAIVVGFPTPFCLIMTSIPWFVMVMAAVWWTKRQELRGNRQLVDDTGRLLMTMLFQMTMTVLYALVAFEFNRLSSAEQTGFVLLLPVLKTIFKYGIARLLPDRRNGTPVAVVFTCETFHAMYVAFCMQSSSSVRTVLVMMVVDLARALISHHSMMKLVRQLTEESSPARPPYPKSIQPTTHKADLLKITQATTTGSQFNLSNPIASINSVVHQSQVHPQTSSTEQTPTKTVSDENRSYPCGFKRALTAVLPAPLGSSCEDSTLNGARATASDTAWKLLYTTELVVLVEYVEVVTPAIYSVVVTMLHFQANRVFYPFLKTITFVDLWSKLANVWVYSSLEFGSLLVLTVVTWRTLGISVIHQLAFVLEKRQNSLDHYGADYTFQFKWLRQIHQAQSDG